uniref:ZP domain-containing protein n=1 Tax=Stegastes partitus TaxID=144197 RepID=A0A3B5A235_9TELE
MANVARTGLCCTILFLPLEKGEAPTNGGHEKPILNQTRQRFGWGIQTFPPPTLPGLGPQVNKMLLGWMFSCADTAVFPAESWTSTAKSNIYKRGQVVNLQVSAEMRPDHQLFVQSCFVSASPEPQTRPSRVLIFTLYIHCSVLVSDQGVTSGSKSCSYNVIQSRLYFQMGGTKNVLFNLSHTGPLVIVDKGSNKSPALPVSKPQETSSAPVPNTKRSYVPDLTEDVIAAGSSVSRSFPQGVVVVSQDPASRLTLWLPGELQNNEYDPGSQSVEGLTVELHPSADISDDPDLQPTTTDRESNLNPSSNEIEGQSLNEASVSGLNLLTMVDGWPIPPQLDKAVVAEELRRKKRLGGSEKFGSKAVDLSLPAEISVNYLMLVEKPNVADADNMAIAEESQRKRWFPAGTDINDLNQMRDELAEMQRDAAVMTEEGTYDDQPIIRSKLEFFKGTDGSQLLSYEEEVKQTKEGKSVAGRFGRDGTKRKQKYGLKGMLSTFLDLLRYTNFYFSIVSSQLTSK